MARRWVKWLGGGALSVVVGVVILINLGETCACDPGKVASIKANMHKLQLGIEQYAGDHNSKYPEGIARATGGGIRPHNSFSWAKYVNVNGEMHNPFSKSISGLNNMEADIQVKIPKGTSIYTVAEKYSGNGIPGGMRYFVSIGNQSQYAIIGINKNGDIIRETPSSNKNYVLHN